jgi:hypothetical protein
MFDLVSRWVAIHAWVRTLSVLGIPAGRARPSSCPDDDASETSRAPGEKGLDRLKTF